MSNIRRQVVKWQRHHKSQKVRDLKEHVHYEIQVKPADEVHNSVSLECKVCGKSYLLGWSKQNKPIISNWTRHVVTCLDSKRTSKSKKLQTYLTTSSSSDVSTGCTSQPISVSPELLSGRAAISGDSEPEDDLVTRREVVPPPLSSFQLASNVQEDIGTDPQLIAEGRTNACTNSSNQHFRLPPPNQI